MDSVAFKGSTAMDQERITSGSFIERSLRCSTTRHVEKLSISRGAVLISKKRKKDKENPKESSS